MVVTAEWTERDRARLDELITDGEAAFRRRQPRSAALLEDARRVLAGGATSNWQIAWPQMVWVSHGRGSRIYDVDGEEYVDLHGGYGVGICGHGHPKIVRALSDRVPRGTHFAQPTEDAVAVARNLAHRFGLPQWRFNNSGTEATMDAVHLVRAATGRDLIVKIEGAYHGHHDSVMVSVANELNELGSARRPHNPTSNTGIPRAIAELTLIAPFNDVDVMRRLFEEYPDQIAGVILEPIMMNAGIIPPDDGYLEEVRRLTSDHNALLVFDEVKTGLTVGPGGATGLFGVRPDIICLAKATGGGLPCGAIGGTNGVMNLIADGEYEQVGTFNGNPLTMAAARAALTEILDADAHAHLDRLCMQMTTGVTEIVAEHELPAHVVAYGAKGCVVFSRERVSNYRDFLAIDERFSHAHWLFQHNGGVFLPPWGKAEQWMLSVQHTSDDVRLFVENFASFARALRS